MQHFKVLQRPLASEFDARRCRSTVTERGRAVKDGKENSPFPTVRIHELTGELVTLRLQGQHIFIGLLQALAD